MPHDFPVKEVLVQYASPLTSWSGDGAAPFTREELLFRLIDIPSVVSFCENRFSWAHDSAAMFKKFQSILWEACLLRQLYLDVIESSSPRRLVR